MDDLARRIFLEVMRERGHTIREEEVETEVMASGKHVFWCCHRCSKNICWECHKSGGYQYEGSCVRTCLT